MATLYPPYIEGKLPAQVGDTLRIPYQLNRAVGEIDLQGAKIRAKIKTVSTNSLVSDQVTGDFLANSSNGVYSTELDLKGPVVNLTIGQFYKIQLCFEKEGYSGQYFSTVGVFKYTTQPNVFIDDLDPVAINGVNGSFVGKYQQKSLTDWQKYIKEEGNENKAQLTVSLPDLFPPSKEMFTAAGFSDAESFLKWLTTYEIAKAFDYKPDTSEKVES